MKKIHNMWRISLAIVTFAGIGNSIMLYGMEKELNEDFQSFI